MVDKSAEVRYNNMESKVSNHPMHGGDSVSTGVSEAA